MMLSDDGRSAPLPDQPPPRSERQKKPTHMSLRPARTTLSPSSASPSPTKWPRHVNDEAAIQAWTLPLPDGYEWPENVPRDYPAGGSAMSGEQIVRSRPHGRRQRAVPPMDKPGAHQLPLIQRVRG